MPALSTNQIEIDDYQKVAAAIQFIQAHRRQQPSLAAIAAHVHLSEYHFQKLFSRWVGVSPKRFLQLLTVEYAKQQLTTSASLLNLSLEAGLSSSSRLHDLFVTLEAMTPAAYRAGGAGLKIFYGIHSSPFGWALIAQTERGICNFLFLESVAVDEAAEWLQAQWPQAVIDYDPEQTKPVCDRFQPATNGTSPKPLSLLVRGTNFQIQVWRALLTLPVGHLVTYQDIATAIGKPKATRAVGTAIGANPVAYLIPCHRVIRSTGELGGYRWGLSRKSALLGWEACQLQRANA